MYKQATKMKLRFASVKGQLTIEDLYDLPLTSVSLGNVSLDEVAKGINRQLKECKEESFVEVPSKEKAILQLKLDIVKDVIAERLKDNKAAEDRVKNKAKREKILAALDRKEDGDLEDMSADELTELLKETEV